MPLKSRTTGVQAPAPKADTKPVTNRASRQASDLTADQAPPQGEPEGQEGTAKAEAQQGTTQPPRGRRGAAPAADAPPKATRAPRQTRVAADGAEPVDNPKARLKELEAQAKQLLKDESAAITEVTAEFREKRRALQQEHARISGLVAKSIFG